MVTMVYNGHGQPGTCLRVGERPQSHIMENEDTVHICWRKEGKGEEELVVLK